MSAQPDTAVQNGVGSREEPTQPAREGGCDPPQQRIGGEASDVQQPHAEDVRRQDVEQPRMQTRNPGESPSVMQTDPAPQVGQPDVPTMVDLARRSSSGHSDLGHQAEEQPLGYVTPRSTSGIRAVPQSTWLTGMELPKWMARLGSILQHPGVAPTELAPSPYPSVSSVYSPPPGDPTFRLRSPAKARAIPATPTPPSSSSIPAEAIQAEVQRQLQGVLGQLREYGETNQRLHAELLDTRAKLREEQERNSREHTIMQPMTLLGNLSGLPLDPGQLPGDPIASTHTALPTSAPVLQQSVQPPSNPMPLHPGLPEPSSYIPQKDGAMDGGRAEADVPQGGLGGFSFRSGEAPLPSDHPRTSFARAAAPEAEGPGLLRSWWEGRPRSTTPPPKVASDPQGSPVLDALTRGVQQLQELQMQAMAKATTTTGAETVKPGTISLTAMPETKDGAESALTFQDWLEISSSTMSDISEASGTWWNGVLAQVEMIYEKWLAATPLERLNIEPTNTDEWTTGRWTRVNARAATMILTAMPEQLRLDMVARRSAQNCVKMMFRAYTHYQPGGGAERHDVLRRLQNPIEFTGGDSLAQVLQTLRAWPRWMERCRRVHMVPPDPTVLARGLMGLTDKYISSSTDANFRTAMLRTTLRLDARPTTEQVTAYQRHLQAELESMLASQSGTPGGQLQPKLRAVEQTTSPKAKDGGYKSAGSPDLCRYFAKASGCKRGDKCSYSHSMSSMEKDVRARKCLKCGAESHRQKACPVGRSATKASTQAKDGVNKPSNAAAGPVSVQSTMATTGTTETTTSSPSQGTPWTLEALIQAAQQVVQPQPVESAGDSSPEKTKPQLRTLKLRDIRICATRSSTTALLDSGATHSLRTARSDAEWNQASEVMVQLAGSYSLAMRITDSGTLLMPYKEKKLVDDEGGPRAQTIVPMGQLIQTLGYTMVWSKDSCYLESQEGERVLLQVTGGCPQMQEMEALSLIARLEDRKKEELDNAILTSKDKLGVCALAMERTWEYYLMDYVLTGSFESGLRAVRDAPFFADLPGECLWEMIPTKGLWSGWEIMKDIGYFTRAQRRKIIHSKRWVVHLFAGKEGHWEIMKLDQGDTTVIELDLARCKGHDVFRDETWRMLMWGAKEGKIDVILGGPPARSRQKGSSGDRDLKDVALVARMMWLHALSQVGREVNGTLRSKNRDVGFVMEYPEGISTAATEEMLTAREAEVRDCRTRGEAASWNYANWYWEYVQRPSFELYAGKPTMDGAVPFWSTRLWKVYQRESGLQTVSFDQGAMGGGSRNRTTLATNINNLMSLQELRLPEGSDLPDNGPNDAIWSPGLVEALVVGLSFWDREPHCAPRIQAFTPEQWKQHVDSNHEVYRKDCLTCVTSRGTGRQHRRVHHPESYVLTADVAGPLSKGLDPTSKGTMGKNLKYLLVAKYMVPKAYVQLHSGVCPPSSDGCEPDESQRAELAQQEDDPLLKELFGEEESSDRERDPEPVEVIQIPNPREDLEDCVDYEPSEPGEEVEEDRPDQGEALAGSQDQVMANGDCKPPELTFLIFAVGLENNQSATVRRALQDIVLYLQMHSFPIYRFHSDKGEFFNHSLRSWLRDHSIYATWSEPGIPQGNGHAEGAVRWTKDRVRTLLRSSSLPTKLWPVAAAAAAAQQRAKVLGWRSHLAAPFGATVHLKRKAFDEKGPQRREQSLESKWQKGRYVGLSTVLHHGHLVYVPAEGEEKEKFFHTAHVRPNLIDPGQPDMELSAEPPKPKRRLIEKSSLDDIELRAMDASAEVIQQWATEEAKSILANWSLCEAKELINKLAKANFFNERKFGVYRHGGSVGWMKGMQEFPDLVRLLTRLVTGVEPTATFTAILVSYNTQKPLHKDFNNDPRTYNYVTPTQVPPRGGELWVELRPGDYVKGTIEQRSKGGRLIYGQCLPLEEDKAIKIGPMSAHEVCHWEGERIVVIGYSPQCLGKLNYEDIALLHDYGFPIPLSQLPEFYANEEAEAIQLRAIRARSEEESGTQPEEPDWTMYLDLNPGMAKLTDSTQFPQELPQARKTEVVYTPDIENVLSALSGPLDVTYTVSPADVMAHLERWKPAIEKELKSIEVAIERLTPGSEARKRWLNRPGAQRLPTKFVFTVKLNDRAVITDPATWYKRKARLVVCGNMAAEDGAAVYTETAPAEAVRAGLTLATRYKWTVAVLDVVAAFLRTPMNRSAGDPIVVVQPPRLLETMGLVVPTELWGLIRALYGLRQSPALWGDFRDYTLRTTTPPKRDETTAGWDSYQLVESCG